MFLEILTIGGIGAICYVICIALRHKATSILVLTLSIFLIVEVIGVRGVAPVYNAGKDLDKKIETAWDNKWDLLGKFIGASLEIIKGGK